MHFSWNIPAAWRPYMRFVPPAALLAGMIFDFFLLNRPDSLLDNAILLGYLTISAFALTMLQLRAPDESDGVRVALLTLLQFSFGNLASGLLILYARSGTLAGSAIFLGMLILLLLGNEFLKSRYARAHLRVVIWFVLLTTYCALVVPVILGVIGPLAFLASVAAAIAIVSLLILVLLRLDREQFSVHLPGIRRSIGGAALLFVLLYFLNVIPPVPLALKHIGIYHHVLRDGDMYIAEFESPAWYAPWRATNKTFHHNPEDTAFCFSSVFATPGLTAEIQHRWERYNPETQQWETIARIPFSIRGGRDEGFRGYSQTLQLSAGEWRCSVETTRGALIGREQFIIESTYDEYETQTTRL